MNHKAMKVCNDKINTYEHYSQNNLKPFKCAAKAVTIFHQNICGLPNKEEELLQSLSEHPAHKFV